MPYIGKQPTVGNFQVCDAISVVNGQAAYTMQVGGSNVEPENANHMLVSLNGVLQKPGSSFTISGSTITFASNLATGDVIDFIILLGDVLNIGAPSDDAVATASIQANAVTAAKLNNDIISGQTALGATPADTDELLISDAGTIKRVDYSYIKGGFTLGTPVTGSGSNITFTGIPSTARLIIVSFDNISHSHSSNSDFKLLLGDSGGLETTGYTSNVIYTGTSDQGGNTYTNGHTFYYQSGNTNLIYGLIVISCADVSNNKWCISAQAGTQASYINHSAGSKTLSGTLTQLQILSGAGGGIDAGTVNIMYQ